MNDTIGIDMEKLRDEFVKKVRHQSTVLQDIREVVEAKLAQMLAQNPNRMDSQQKYEEIVAAYNSDKDRVTIEETFRGLEELMEELSVEQGRAVEQGLSEEELAVFDLMKRERLSQQDREKVKLASCSLLSAIQSRLGGLDRFWEKEQTKAEVEVFILDEVYRQHPSPPCSSEEKKPRQVWSSDMCGNKPRATVPLPHKPAPRALKTHPIRT